MPTFHIAVTVNVKLISLLECFVSAEEAGHYEIYLLVYTIKSFCYISKLWDLESKLYLGTAFLFIKLNILEIWRNGKLSAAQ